MGMDLNQKDSMKRKFILEGNMWKVVMAISFPLAMYNCFNNLYSFLDAIMAAHIGSEVVSAIAYLAQIKSMIMAIGAGLSVSGGIIIARCYGAGDLQSAKKYVNTLLFLAVTIGLCILFVIVPFAKPILRLIKTPQELINVGSTYFVIEITMVVVIFINNVYIVVEKAKGNTKRILLLNLQVLGIKLILTSLFVYVFHFGITMMAMATMIANLYLLVIGIIDMSSSKNIFRISIKNIDLSKKTIGNIIRLAFPIFIEKFAFSFGKVIVNSMSTLYGSLVVGALGVSNNINGITTGTSNGFQDGESSIISQNLGNENLDRALDAFKKTLVVSLTIGVIGFIVTGIFTDQIVELFAKGDVEFARHIKDIFKYERQAIITLTLTSAIMGLLYGFGYTKLSLVINFLRLFAFRIPSLYILQNYTNLGSKSVGVAMMISNNLMGLTAVIVCIIVIYRMKKKANQNDVVYNYG